MAKFKRVVSAALALSAVCASVATFSACETAHPEVQITLSFNKQDYTLDYTLYRKVAPATVEHFLTLAENGYYDGLCVHDYDDSRMYTGGYSYQDGGANGGLIYKNYYEIVKSYIPQTVWQDQAKTLPTYTLYGEFEGNKFSVKNNGHLLESFGSLTMYYTEKEDCEDSVYVQRSDGDGVSTRGYEYNSATSLFYISLSTGTKTNKNYCTFALLSDDSTSELTALQTAIADYIEDNYGEEEDAAEDFVTDVTLEVDADDIFVGGRDNEETYQVPNEPIVVKKVEVKKY